METPSQTKRDGRVAEFARRGAPWGFPVVYLGWAYLFWSPVVASGESVWSFPNVVLFGIGGLSPLVAGLGLLWLSRGRRGMRDLRGRLTDAARVGRLWWLVLLVFWPALTLAVGGAALLLGVSSSPLEIITVDRLLDPGAVTALVGFAFLFPLVEEVGLRGYWFDRLQERWSALVSSLVLGVVWAAWHVPLPLMTGYYAGTTFQPELWWWLPDIVLTAVVTTWVYNNTGRSVLAVVCFHAFGNLRGELMGYSPELYPFAVVGTVAVAVLVVAGWSPGSLRGWGRPRPSVEPSSG